MDGRKNNGAKKGVYQGQGRKPKRDELSIIEQMDKRDPEGKVWNILWQLVEEKDPAAVKLWLAYRHGAPVQQINANNTNTVKIVDESTDSSFTPPASGPASDHQGA